ncbi:MAG: cardiolipin synthase [Verrucomicrobia bacterium CG_4_10_14_3_um_filter_43_23]|nr:MAG: hypothetical protein AUJ82_07965 [Verrucomicrobia bacterium CG1_02_43_26]PIP59371.1 MAG: cardiolipin synthase [Verrucomicrobia bacterium CG22_combo_CG10-13_8_21_14_all_43_17]PIX57996.1 MAG: cardiolipin synthase [Verrucomicrobia bacterium CG_4_10_14_3_um_filter_43_23]PIY61285.1 MAG: cardiolipin synthase [Verrucomicrobia bacterium CG_4_10_14_0_8_um_filter_43_34]PJA44264.1 MAG: cardiolipin synthase [Verrucomicrobia bacterium CG_4_9_14_3_um_filter_43_20]
METNPLYLWAHEHDSVWNFLSTVVVAHLITLVGFLFALLIVGRMFNEKRNPSNIFAWTLAIFFVPYVSVPLYFLFGGFKSQRLVKNKKHVIGLAAEVAGVTNISEWMDRQWSGNSFELLGDGEVAYDAFCREIKNATKNIAIMTYIITNDPIGQKILELLIQKTKEGVDVKLLVDAFGSLGSAGKFLQPLRDAGGQAVRFMPMIPVHTKTSANLRNHRKMAIFDEKRVIIGGQNIDERFLGKLGNPKLFHDFSVLIEGPAVDAMQRIFISDWCFTTGENPEKFRDLMACTAQPAGDVPIGVVASGPDSDNGDTLWEKLIKLIQDSKEHIDIVTPYFAPDEVLFQSLLVKAKAGHSIRLIIPEKSNQTLVDFARHYYLRKLYKAGVNILLYKPGMLHAKLFIVDKKVGMLGSANMDIRSMFVNFEISIFVSTKEPIDILQAWLDKLLPLCTPYGESKQASAGENRRIMEDFAHLLVPLL